VCVYKVASRLIAQQRETFWYAGTVASVEG